MSRRGLALVAAGLLAGAAPVRAQDDWVPQTSILGMSGLVNTPTADVIPSDALRIGLIVVDKQWTHDQRGKSDAHHYFLTVGFIPRVEVSLRFTHHPDDRLDNQLTEPGTVDRGGSGRLLVLTEGKTRPALAVGIDDVRGTRRFHSLYAVGSKWVIKPGRALGFRVSGGYGSDLLVDGKEESNPIETGHEPVLNGWFGGGELVYGNFVSVGIDFDTEKWNTNIRLIAFQRLAAHFALLKFEAPAGGVTWTQRF